MTDPSMVAYLEYLQYWQLPEYARLLMFPWCLYSLRLLTIVSKQALCFMLAPPTPCTPDACPACLTTSAAAPPLLTSA